MSTDPRAACVQDLLFATAALSAFTATIGDGPHPVRKVRTRGKVLHGYAREALAAHTAAGEPAPHLAAALRRLTLRPTVEDHLIGAIGAVDDHMATAGAP